MIMEGLLQLSPNEVAKIFAEGMRIGEQRRAEERGELPAYWMQKKVYQRFPRCWVESLVRQGVVRPRKVVSQNGGKTAKVLYPVAQLFALEAAGQAKIFIE